MDKELVSQRRKITGMNFSMLVPVDFQIMDDEIARIKYPMENRPEVILTNDSANVDYKLSRIDETVDDNLLEELLRQVKSGMKRVYTGIEFFEEHVEMVNNSRLGWLEYVSPAIGGKQYNITFFTWIKGKLINGTFSCGFMDACLWRAEFLGAMTSIEETKDE